MNSETRACQNCKSDFTIRLDDFRFYEKIKVPPPTFCPECRMIRRMSWRNERVLYKNKCSLCTRDILAVYDPKSELVVYCRECWISGKWDANEYSKEFDWNKDFLSQFSELLREVPLIPSDLRGTNINSEYSNYSGNCKNCYLCFSVTDSEDLNYVSNSQDLRQCMDSRHLRNSELCYENTDSDKVYHSIYTEKSREIINSAFVFGCSNSSNSFMAANLRNQNNIFRDKKLTPEEYIQKISEINLGSFKVIENLKIEFNEIKKVIPYKYSEIKNSPGAVGDNITNSKDVYYSFDVENSENVKYSSRILSGCRDVYDCLGMKFGELMYESFGCGYNPSKNFFSFSLDQCKEIQYSALCRSCSNCFGCVGLKNKSYCILNKQYTRDEYEKMVPQIINHMNEVPYKDNKGHIYLYGDFLPTELSFFAYNETIAQDNFALTKEGALQKGFKWKDREKMNYKIDYKSVDIPDDIKDIDDKILNKVIECQHKGSCNEQCTEAFKIVPEELKFYKRMNLPLPRLCPNCRHCQRMEQKTPFKLWYRSCMKDKCKNEFQTSYAPERSEIVYCEKCYQQEIY